ncbi:DNA repair protein XRCC2 [Stylophora pistillata]|uniref:DNA repair protein XRCC2 n=1 Tax=Stylophora pistillata TaxID=50429 RepID=A0A2B4SE15_STYPI|nr:DNA repair protein XRCC2 [Stylophora pistillata]
MNIYSSLFVRLGGKQALGGLDLDLFADIPDGVQPGNVIEFCGMEGSGKTEMLLHLIANCILPRSWKDLKLNGRSVGVVFVDNDFHFQLLRLVTIMEHRILKAIRDADQSERASESDRTNPLKETSAGIPLVYPEKYSDYESLIKSCLGLFFIVRCNSSIELLATVLSLENLLAAKPEVGVFMIDSLSAFYWLDRGSGAESLGLQESNQRKVVNILQKYVQKYHVALIATKQSIFMNAEKSTNREYLCQLWQRLVNHRYEFDRNIVQTGVDITYSVHRTFPLSRRHQRFFIKESGIEFMR